jgi:hypothetical protein
VIERATHDISAISGAYGIRVAHTGVTGGNYTAGMNPLRKATAAAQTVTGAAEQVAETADSLEQLLRVVCGMCALALALSVVTYVEMLRRAS